MYLDISERVLLTLRQINRAIDLYSKQLEKYYGLTGPQLLLLKAISHMDQVSVGELARKVSLSQATVTDILYRLESKGFIRRVKSSQDKRRVMVKITTRSSEILNMKPSLLQQKFVSEFNKLQEWEQNLILSSIQRLASMMKVEYFHEEVENIDRKK